MSQHRANRLFVIAGSIPAKQLRDLLDSATRQDFQIKILPTLNEQLRGVDQLPIREVSCEDLLRRQPAKLNLDAIESLVADRTILVTGAGGSIAMHKSGTSGLSWLSIPGPTPVYNEQAWYNLTVEVDPKNENRVIVGVLSNAISEDGGSSWTPITGGGSSNPNVHVDQHAIVYDDLNSNNLYLGNDG